ncbi:MAG TPA: PAS domain-containing protein [Caldimonas sp.]
MFLHPMNVASLLGLAAALVWLWLRPGPAAVIAALGCVGWFLWSTRQQVQAERGALAAKLAVSEQRSQSHRAAAALSDAARSSAEAERRSAEERSLLVLRGSQDGLWEYDLGSATMEFSPRWKSMLGLASDEIRNDRAAWLDRVHADDRAGLEAALARHLDGSDARFEHEMRLVHRDGRVRNVLSRGVALRDESGRPYRMVGLDTDVTRLKRVQTVLDAVAEGTAGAFGDEFFRAMVHHFARALEVDRAFITECADDPVTRVRTLAVWSAESGHAENFEYALAGTPCAEVVGEGRVCFHRENVSTMFPSERGVESFLGLPIIASDGRMLGHLAFFDSKPRGDDMLVDSIFRIFLARAAAEIERIQALARLAFDRRPAPT